ncbi:hypothetical protein M413DRAFT_325021 [Hebeloma cylindrosporum]|uniref:Uncharacterized protein n=1 Tax=Hebeloma cylindrosporum TaxID=76867 RepID=A0A0C3BV19_HEBCY|nr:hypothetical protein M413DRAFT_325021 [Hebeloma cylindrosporum h7]
MAEEERSYGRTLPDQVDRIADFFDAQLEVINDVRDLYTTRVALERDYATKLQLLTRKASEKKAKASSAFILGNEPTKPFDNNTLKQSTLDAAFDEIITSMFNSAQDHINLADALTSQTIEILRILEKKNEEVKKKEMQFFQKLLSDRDRTYTERLKSKQKYDEDCAEVESFRQKQGRASDDKHADRAAKQAEQQRNDMLHSKNTYLISMAIANQATRNFYEEDVPKVEDELQGLQHRLLERFVKILLHAQKLQLGHLETLKSRVTNVELKLNQVNVVRDQNLFIDYNLRTFIPPEDWKFEPCAVHYDTEAMSVEPSPKVFIQNKLRRSREKLAELIPLIESKRAELNQLSLEVSSYTPDHSVGHIDELTDRYLDAEHQLAFYATSERILNTEIDTILAAIGDDVGGSQPHSFKSSSFSIPTQCGYCKSSIWGLTKQGKTCTACGLSVHAKCELKVPASCEKSGEHPSASTMLFRRVTKSGRKDQPSVPTMTPSASSFVQSISSEDTASADEIVENKVLFEYTATSEFELGVQEGTTVRVLEPDDGSGWVKVEDDAGNSGLVPASYLGPVTAPVSRKLGSGEHQGTGERVRALYPYSAQGMDELDLQPGDVLELSAGPTGGQNYGGGWWEGFNAKGRKGIFPSNYVESA